VVDSSIEKLKPQILEEYKKQSLKPLGKISLDYLQRFSTLIFKISEYYSGSKKFSAGDVEIAIREIKDLEDALSIKTPSQIYSTVASLYISLAEKTEWKKVPEIIEYYNKARGIYKMILGFETDSALKSDALKRIGNLYWEISQYLDKKENCKKAIKAYGKALKVRTLERFPMDYAMTQNNLGAAYSRLAEVEEKAENCKKAIKAYGEALKVYTLERFPMQYATTQNNLGNAYSTLAEVEEKAENCKKAIKAYGKALKVFTEKDFPQIYPLIASNLKNLLEFCGGDR
jgi:tetratricopeptide (TPR) repeat protein